MSRGKVRTDYKLVAQTPWHAAIGERLKRERTAKGVSLRELERRIGLTYFTIRRHEAGEMMMRTDDLMRAAEALQCAPSALYVPLSEWRAS
jgi:transcriptional regulator with XRE-family HTH domain